MALPRQLGEALSVVEQVCGLLAVAACDHNEIGAQAVDGSSQLLQLGLALAWSALARSSEDTRLRHVRGHGRHPWEQPAAELVLGILVEQAGTALGHHD